MQFLSISLGSCAELETQLILVNEIYDLDTQHLQNECIEIQKMLFMMIKKVRERED